MKEKEKRNLMFFIFALECKKFESNNQIRDPKKKKKTTEHRGSVGEMWTCGVVNNATTKLLWFRA